MIQFQYLFYNLNYSIPHNVFPFISSFVFYFITLHICSFKKYCSGFFQEITEIGRGASVQSQEIVHPTI